MLATIGTLRNSSIQAGNFTDAEEIVQTIDVRKLVLDRGQTIGVFSELVEILQQLPDPQCAVGQWLVNIFQWHWKHVPTEDAYELLGLCKSQIDEVRHVGAHHAMAETLENEKLAIVAGDA